MCTQPQSCVVYTLEKGERDEGEGEGRGTREKGKGGKDSGGGACVRCTY